MAITDSKSPNFLTPVDATWLSHLRQLPLVPVPSLKKVSLKDCKLSQQLNASYPNTKRGNLQHPQHLETYPLGYNL